MKWRDAFRNAALTWRNAFRYVRVSVLAHVPAHVSVHVPAARALIVRVPTRVSVPAAPTRVSVPAVPARVLAARIPAARALVPAAHAYAAPALKASLSRRLAQPHTRKAA